MEKEIPWEPDLNEAIDRAQREQKTVLLDFHNPN
jgi:hypothetical protein